MRFRRSVSLFIAVLAVASCGDKSGQGPVDVPVTGPVGPVSEQAARGRATFAANCSSCHAAADGYDLAFFHYPDSTIVRRALGHVDQAAAADIVAHIATLQAPMHQRDERLFQPGATVLANDAAFGQALFSGDVFPASLTTAQVRAMDPLNIRIAIALPRWSVESANTDWMPDIPLPAAILADQGNAPAQALTAYRASPTQANLRVAMTALFSATHRNDSPGPCHFESRGRIDAVECFQVMRWGASLVAQHMMRNNLTRPFADTIFHNMWWEVGDAVRRAPSGSVLAQNSLTNRVGWMYLGWMFGADARPSLYILPSFESAGLWRHATWVAVKSMTDRPVSSALPYDDLVNIPRYGHDIWLYGALRFSYNHLLERIRAGDVPPSNRLSEARTKITASFNESSPRVTTAQRDELRTLSQAVLAALPAN